MNKTSHERQTAGKPVRLGCVGLGEVFAIRHLPVLQDNQRVEVIATLAENWYNDIIYCLI